LRKSAPPRSQCRGSRKDPTAQQREENPESVEINREEDEGHSDIVFDQQKTKKHP